MDVWFQKVWLGFQGFLSRVADNLPNVLGAIAVLIAAWVLARILRFVFVRLLEALDRLFERWFTRGVLSNLRLPQWAVRILGGLVFWITMLIGLDVATRVLDLPVSSQWLDTLISSLPTLIAAVVIIIIGILASSILRDVATTSARAAGLPQAARLGIVVQAVALVFATVVGLNQLGIGVDLPITVFAVVLGAALGGLALAFGLGARPYVTNVLAARHVARLYRVGTRVRFGEYEGIVSSVGPTFITIGTVDGTVAIPAGLFFDQVSLAVQVADDD